MSLLRTIFDNRRLLHNLNDSGWSDELGHSMGGADDLTASLDSLVSGSDVEDTMEMGADSLASMNADSHQSTLYDSVGEEEDGTLFLDEERSIELASSSSSVMSVIPPPADETLSLATSWLVISTDDFDSDAQPYSLDSEFSMDSNEPCGTSTPLSVESQQSLDKSDDISYDGDDCVGQWTEPASPLVSEASSEAEEEIVEPLEALTFTIRVSSEVRRKLKHQAGVFAKIDNTIRHAIGVLNTIKMRCDSRKKIGDIKDELRNMLPRVASIKEKSFVATRRRMLASSGGAVPTPLVTIAE